MDTHTRLYGSFESISTHVSSLTSFALNALSSLKHYTSKPLIRIHSSHSSQSSRGPIIGFTVIDPHGTPIGHSHLSNLATLAGIQIRTGGLCNTGIIARLSSLSDDDLLGLYESGRVCGDNTDFAVGEDGAKKPLGVGRISFGPTTRMSDVLAFIDFLKRYFLVSEGAQALSTAAARSDTGVIACLQDLIRCKSQYRFNFHSII